MAASSFVLTPLVENTSIIAPAPQKFDPRIAWLLAQCCNLTYSQFNLGPGKLPDFSTLTLGPKYQIQTSNGVPFTVSEPSGPGSVPGDPGNYYPAAAGFGVTITIKDSGSTVINVIALRGTSTWTEWLDDADAVPAVFDGKTDDLYTSGLVHSGILNYYTLGTNGQTYDPGVGWMTKRPPGSLAAQIQSYMVATGRRHTVVTGHSLGGALASICALDIALNFKSNFLDLFMYNLASPRLAMGASLNTSIPISVPTGAFLKNYQANVPNSFRIVHACDVVPIAPSADLALGLMEITAAHVTDGWSYQGQSSPGLPNVINFCAQSGDLATNHSCNLTYVPYTQWLAQSVPEDYAPSLLGTR